MLPDDSKLYEKLANVFQEITFAGTLADDARTRDFCFHMTDWVADLKALAGLYERGDEADNEEWFQVVHGFLIHISGHLAAGTALAKITPVEFDIPAGPTADPVSGG